MMRKFTLLLLFTCSIVLSQNTYIPDDNFEQALIDLGYDSGTLDDYVPTANIKSLTNLTINSKNIKDLTGIQDFAALKNLSAPYNKLKNINLSKNTNLEKLTLHNNELTSLDISNNPLITWLNVYNNQFVTIQISNNSALSQLYVSNLDDLNTNNNPNLKLISLNNSNITSLNVSNNTQLTHLICNNNKLTSLDVSQNSKLKTLEVKNNQLTFLNLRNGKNTKLSTFNATNNPDLTCIEVDNKDYSDTNWDDLKDNTAKYSETCSSNDATYVPDDNFEQALIDLGYDSGALDNYVPTANIDKVTYLYIQGKSISDLTGIQDFIELGLLYANRNNLTSIDLTKNTRLNTLNLDSNQLKTLDVSKNTELTSIFAANNQLTSLELSTNNKLTSIQVDNNQLTSLDVSLNKIVNFITAGNNKLNNLNLQNGNNSDFLMDTTFKNNPELTCIQVDNSDFSNANWDTFKDETAYFSENCDSGLTYVPDDNFEQALIDLGYDSGALDDYVPTANIDKVTYLYIQGKSIRDLTGIQDFIELGLLYANRNNLTSIDLTKNTRLNTLNLDSNQLKTLDVSKNTELTSIFAANNQLTSLELSTNNKLTSVQVDNNQLTSLDVSLNKVVNFITAGNNKLNNLNLQNGNNSDFLMDTTFKNNPELTCIQVDNTDFSNANWNTFKDETAYFSENCDSGLTYVPDDNFEQALIDLGYDSGALDDYVPTANIDKVTYLYIQDKSIRDLTGIQDFIELGLLYANRNNLTSIDLTKSTRLNTLNLDSNQLKTLDLSKNTELTSIFAANNQLTSLELSTNNKLTSVQVDNNQLTSLDVSLNKVVNFITADNNKLNSLNLKNGNNSDFLMDTTFKNNPELTCIQVDNTDFSNTNWNTFKDETASYDENCVTNSIKKFSLQNIQLYPNPANNLITIQIDHTIEKIDIYTVHGVKIGTAINGQVDVSKLNSGIYLAKIYTNTNKSGIKRFIKQ
ncbi:T9SS type A sorting domain-containing protein [Tenacibaculum sp. nBUS_03]|uniref:T9SS type A sorting domain-containing protein n=1 Tax=Tenacibaculum sp. nBUS_03 TaxID=3395320 RepID=UPI003EB8DA02